MTTPEERAEDVPYSFAPQTPSSPKEARVLIPRWASIIGALLGAFITIVVANLAAMGVGVFLMAQDGMFDEGGGFDFSNQEAMMRYLMSYPSVAISVALTAIFLSLSALVTARLSRAPAKTALGFQGAPWPVFLLAPIGILALGPTSDLLVRTMAEFFPDWTLGSLEQIEELTKNASFWALFPIIAICPGFSEEIFFRGLVQRAWGFGWAAITISAISFSLFHMDPHHVAGVLPLGFYLAWLGARTGSLWVCVLTHTVNNTVALAASKFSDVSMDAEEGLPWYYIPIGWVIAGFVIYGIWRLTKDQAACLGPARDAAQA